KRCTYGATPTTDGKRACRGGVTTAAAPSLPQFDRSNSNEADFGGLLAAEVTPQGDKGRVLVESVRRIDTPVSLEREPQGGAPCEPARHGQPKKLILALGRDFPVLLSENGHVSLDLPHGVQPARTSGGDAR